MIKKEAEKETSYNSNTSREQNVLSEDKIVQFLI